MKNWVKRMEIGFGSLAHVVGARTLLYEKQAKLLRIMEAKEMLD